MNIYQHFRKEEHHFIDQVLEWRESVQTQYSPRLTDFLDPREQEIVKLVIGDDEDVRVSFFGGAPFVERKRALLYPPYFQPEEEDFQLALFSLHYPRKFVSLTHRQVLGTLMSLGVKRSKFGDVLMQEDDVQFLVAKEIAPYVQMHLQAVGKTKVAVEEKPLTEIMVLNEQWNEATITVSSLRLDAVVAQAFGASRQHVQTIIANGLIKINWKIVEQAHVECKEGDIISARGLGRLKLISIDGKTKKDRFRLHIGTQK